MDFPASVTRRGFLRTAGAAGAVVALGQWPFARLGSTDAPTVPAPTPSWVDKPMRWAQLTLVEDDPGKFDLQFWLDYFQRTRSDAVCLSAGGCMAYYPTQVPFHHRSAWLGKRDVFGELVAGCRKLGMVVIARTDPHATYDDVQAAHPDWIAVDGAGKPRRHWASPEMWVTCGLGPYNFEFMTEVKREIMSRYRVDAIFINRWDGSGMCWKDSVQSEAEIRLWVADGVANGLRPWFTKFSGVLHDQRWLKPVEELYRRYARWELYLDLKGPVRGLIPVDEQQVRVRLPEGTRAKQVRLLAANRKVRDERVGNYLNCTVPSILDHEVLAIDL